jgi:amino acid transporter
MKKKAPELWVRESTGLVREMGLLEHFFVSTNALPLASIAITPWFIMVAIPGGDPLIATAIAFVFTIFALLSYAITNATFPRSGSPYIAQSRILHPAIGFPSEFLMLISIWLAFPLFPGGYFIYWILSPGLYAMGVSSGSSSLINLAWLILDPTWTIIIGTILLIFFGLFAIAGTKVLTKWYNLPLFMLMALGIVLTIGLLAGTTLNHFVDLTPKYLGVDYNTIIQTARELHPDFMVPASYQLYPLMAAAGLACGAVNTYWSSWNVGEVRKGSDLRTHLVATFAGSILTLAISLVCFWLVYANVGRDFLIAFTQVISYSPSTYNAPLYTGIAAVFYSVMMIADNVVIQFLLVLAMSATALLYIPFCWMVVSRDMFAFAWDRVLPSKFTEVSSRWHSPVSIIVFTSVISEILLFVFTYYSQYVLFLFAAVWLFSQIPIMILCFSVAALPWRKRLWNLSPAKRLGAAVVTITGLIAGGFEAWANWVYIFTPAMGVGTYSIILIFVLVIVSFAAYWIMREVRRRQGIDLDLIFKEIPPE